MSKGFFPTQREIHFSITSPLNSYIHAQRDHFTIFSFQMRLKEKRDKKAAAMESSKMKSSRTHISLHLAKEILQKICLSDIAKSKSCENLHVL